MKTNQKNQIENRIALLSERQKENINIIKKLERKLRKINKENNNE